MFNWFYVGSETLKIEAFLLLTTDLVVKTFYFLTF